MTTTSREKKQLLVRGVAISGSPSQWTLLGTSEEAAAKSVASSRNASAQLSAWAMLSLHSSVEVTVVDAKRIEGEPTAPSRKAKQVNGVSKALSPEYREMFSALSADFISLAEAISSAPKSDTKR